MKRIVLLTLSMLVMASIASAQISGTIAVFADEGRVGCRITDAPGLVHAYVYHMSSDGTEASTFRLVLNGGAALVHVTDVFKIGLQLGSTIAGVAISYQACLTSPIYLADVLFTGTGTSPACSSIDVTNHPDFAFPEAVDCQTPKGKAEVATLSAMIGGDNASCPCPVPVAEMTWGSIKALYN